MFRKMSFNNKSIYMKKCYLVLAAFICFICLLYLILGNNIRKRDTTIASYMEETVQYNMNTLGNTSGNIVNRGYVAFKDDWIIYQDNYFFDIRAVKANGRDDVKISNAVVCADNLNIVDNWIYYCDSLDNFNIYRMSFNGEYRERLTDIQGKRNTQYLNIINGWIYYCEGIDSKHGILYKMKYDGKERTKLTDEYVKDINVSSDNWIYYSSFSDHGKLYKIKTDGGSKTKLSDDNASNLVLSGDYLYYINQSDDNRIYKISIDGSLKTKICNDSAGCINLSGDYIYYSNSSDAWRLYKINKDGSEGRMLSIDDPENINIAGEWIYYTCWNDYFNIYKINVNGSGRQKIR